MLINMKFTGHLVDVDVNYVRNQSGNLVCVGCYFSPETIIEKLNSGEWYVDLHEAIKESWYKNIKHFDHEDSSKVDHPQWVKNWDNEVMNIIPEKKTA